MKRIVQQQWIKESRGSTRVSMKLKTTHIHIFTKAHKSHKHMLAPWDRGADRKAKYKYTKDTQWLSSCRIMLVKRNLKLLHFEKGVSAIHIYTCEWDIRFKRRHDFITQKNLNFSILNKQLSGKGVHWLIREEKSELTYSRHRVILLSLHPF